MRRVAVALAAAGVLGLAGWLLLRDAEPSGPPLIAAGQPVPMDATVLQVRPDEEGGERIWTLQKQSLGIDELPDRVLPAPAPRETPPDEHTESARTLNSIALDALRDGRVHEAAEFFEAAVAADPDDAVARSNYGRLLLITTDFEKALPQLERAAELTPDDPQVWLDLRSLYERAVLLERAAYARRRAEALLGDRTVVQDERGFYRLEDLVYP